MAGHDLPGGNTDVCSPRNVRTGQLVEDSYDPDGLVVGFREDLSSAPTVAYRDGDDNDDVISTTGELESMMDCSVIPAALVTGNCPTDSSA